MIDALLDDRPVDIVRPKPLRDLRDFVETRCGRNKARAVFVGHNAANPERRADLMKAYGDRAVALVSQARDATEPARWPEAVGNLLQNRAFQVLRLLREDFRRLLEPAPNK